MIQRVIWFSVLFDPACYFIEYAFAKNSILNPHSCEFNNSSLTPVSISFELCYNEESESNLDNRWWKREESPGSIEQGAG